MSVTALLRDDASRAPVSQASSTAGWVGGAQDLFIRKLDALLSYHDRAQERRRLGRLDDRLLHDIGVDRATAELEAGKPFWRR